MTDEQPTPYELEIADPTPAVKPGTLMTGDKPQRAANEDIHKAKIQHGVIGSLPEDAPIGTQPGLSIDMTPNTTPEPVPVHDAHTGPMSSDPEAPAEVHPNPNPSDVLSGQITAPCVKEIPFPLYRDIHPKTQKGITLNI